MYELPVGWEWKKLGELCNFIRGPFGGSLKKQIFKESGNAVYEQSHAIYNQFEQIRYFIDDEKFEEMKRFELRPNSLIMSCSGTIGKVAIVPKDIKKGIINQALLMLTPNDELNNIFLKLMIESNFFQTLLSENSTGAAIANVASVKVLKEIKIPLPPLSEQQRIVSKLDLLFEKIDKSIALHQKNMDEANAFMGSVLNDVFGELEEKYETNTLNDVCNKITDGTHKSPKTIEKGYPYITVRDITEKGKINFNDCEFVNNEDFKRLKNGNCAPMKDDVLFSKDGTVGKVTVVDFQKDFVILSSLAILRPSDDLDSYFLYYTMKSPKFFDFAQSKKTGAAIKRVVLRTIKEFEIPKPPLNIQQKVVKYLDEISQKIEKIKQAQKTKMNSLKALKASILDQAFKGEL